MISRPALRNALAIALAFTSACGASVATNGDGPFDDGAVATDAGPAVSDDGAASADAARCLVPDPSSHCSSEGCVLPDITLPSCEPGDEPVRLYGGDFCTAQATLIQVHAPWCVPSMRESVELESTITEAFVGRVRVVTVLEQNVDYAVPTARTCSRFRETYGLTDHTTYDPEARMMILGLESFPVTLLIDRHGVIVRRWVGFDESIHTDIRRAVELMAGQP